VRQPSGSTSVSAWAPARIRNSAWTIPRSLPTVIVAAGDGVIVLSAKY
jgi:hypothetical protein